jgi:hypothetical protein
MIQTTPDETRTPLAPSIRSLLDVLRVRIRQYAWAEGLADAVAWLGFAFWASLAADWFFEPPASVRVLMLLAVAAVLSWIFIKQIGRRAFVEFSDANMATVLERRFPTLDDSLLTTVLLRGRDPSGDGYNPKMFERTCEEAEERVKEVRIGEVFNLVPLRRAISAAVLMLLSIVLFAVVTPRSFGIWAGRMLALSEELWPRECKLVVPEEEGFVNGVRKVARGEDVEIVVRAVPVALGKFTIPRDVEFRYYDESGAHGSPKMDRIGRADPTKDAFQEFSYKRRNVLSPIHFDIKGGDAVLKNMKIEVVESPKVEKWFLDREFPAYTGIKKPREEIKVGSISIAQGTKLTIHAEANKPLKRVRIDCISDDAKSAQPLVIEGEQLSADKIRFQYSLESLNKDTTLVVTLFDTDGIKSRDAFRLSLVAVPDQPPQISAQLDGIGTAITSIARIAVAGRAIDDYGIGKLWFEHGVEMQPSVETLLEPAVEKPADAKVEKMLDGSALEVKSLGLKPGQKFLVTLKAADLCTLGNGPNVGNSEQWTLDVVTPEQLRAILESRELVLRQRFETIMQETTETRDILAHAKKPSAPADSSTSTDKSSKIPGTGEKASESGKEPGDAKKGGTGNEPGDEQGETAKSSSPEEQLALLLFRVQGVSTNCLKSTQEINGLAESFDDIHKQLVNNGLDSPDLKDRLQTGIAVPLKEIGSELLPELVRRLEALQGSLEQSKFDQELRDRAKIQADDVLLAMQKVLDKMIEMEDYNQMVDLLRDVIKMQEQLRTQTEQRQKQKIRDLLKE